MNKKYKLMKYFVLTELNEGIVLYNSLNGSLLYIDEQNYIDIVKTIYTTKEITTEIFEQPELFNRLYESQFIIDNCINETELANLIFLEKYKANTTLKLLLYVTNDCNFSCVYCPQVHTKLYMTRETMDNVVFATEDLIKANNYESISISWFGGEPLLNLDIIEYGMTAFMKIASEYNLKLYSGITTNGYLLNNKTIRKLFDCKVLDYQITLDGKEENHNKNRMLKNNNGTWKIIWSNLKEMQKFDNNFNVIIRINTNIDNLEDVSTLVNMVDDTFDKRFSTKIQPIVNMGNYNLKTNYCSPTESQIIQLSLYDYMSNQNKQDKTLDLSIEPFGLMCNCSDPNYFVIKEDGKVCKCELKVDDVKNIYGTIKNGKFEIDSLKLTPYIVPRYNTECTECRLYPLCFGLTCPYKRIYKQSCSLKDSFLLEEYIKSIAQRLLKEAKNAI